LRVENEERRRVEGPAQDRRRAPHLAFESTLAGVYEWDVETDQVYCTASIWKLIGADPAACRRTAPAGWLCSTRRPHRRPRAIGRSLSRETPLIEIEHCVHLKSANGSGSPCAPSATSSPPPATRAVCSHRAEYQRPERADEALRVSQARAASSPLRQQNRQRRRHHDHLGRIELGQRKLFRLTGRPLASVVSHPLLEYLASPDNDPPSSPLAAAVAGLRAYLHRGDPVATRSAASTST